MLTDYPQFKMSMGEDFYDIEEVHLLNSYCYVRIWHKNTDWGVGACYELDDVWDHKPFDRNTKALMQTIELYRQNNMGLSLEEFLKLTL